MHKKIALLKKANHAYYNGLPEILTNSAYDAFMAEVRVWASSNGLADPFSEEVGASVPASSKRVKHLEKMYSLQDIFNVDEARNWFKGVPATTYAVEYKFDGASLNIVYENGRIKVATTRGDGEEGEDVTQNVPYIKNIPLTVPNEGTFEIRGEVVITKDDFEAANEDRIRDGESPFANARNAAASNLGALNVEKVERARMSFIPYGMGAGSEDFNHTEAVSFISSQGFEDNYPRTITDDIDFIFELYETFSQHRDHINCDIDGMVIKIDDRDMRDELGFTSKFPKWAFAFKFPNEASITTLNDVVWQVGSSGNITPVAIVEPVMIGGALVSRATLHNLDEIARLDVKIGDTIEIIRSGEVIPKILGSIKDLRDDTQVDIVAPAACPSCGEDTSMDGVQVVCKNDLCPDKVAAYLKKIVHRDYLDLDGLGTEAVISLVKQGVCDIESLFAVSRETLAKLEGFAQKKVSTVLRSLREKENGVQAARLLSALPISGIGRTASKVLVKELGEAVFSSNTTMDEFLSVDGVGDVLATNLVEYLNEEKAYVDTLLQRFIVQFPEAVATDAAATGKTFVITGSFNESRSRIKSLLEAQGAKVSSSVSKNTDFLIAGEKAGSKLKKAEDLGVEVLSLEEMAQRFL